MTRFIKYSSDELDYVLECLAHRKGEMLEHARKKWESWYVVCTENDITLSKPSYKESLGIYFQPRAGTGSPVILLSEAVELHRVLDE